MDRFPALRLLLRFGRRWALFVAVMATAVVTWLMVAQLGGWGWLALPVALPFFYFPMSN